MMSESEKQLDEEKKQFLLKHWKTTIVMAVSVVAAAIVAVLVFLSVVDGAIAATLVPVGLGDWTIGYIVTFILHVAFWELVFVATWVIPLVAVFYWWFNKQPDADLWKPKSGKREGGEAFSFFIGIAWLIMIWIDGRWNQAFQAWTFTEWIYSWLTALGWVLLIAGIPITILVIGWLVVKEKKKEPEITL